MKNFEDDLNMFHWWKLVVFKNYYNFSGRARRSEFWSFLLISFMMILPLVYLQFIAAYNRFYNYNYFI